VVYEASAEGASFLFQPEVVMIERYTRPEMGRIWSEENKFKAWLEVEVAAVMAQAKVGRVPKASAETIRRKASFNLQRIAELEQVTDHDLIAFVTCMGESVGKDARFIHLGMTSTDVVDTANAMLLRDSADLMEAGLLDLRKVLVPRQRAQIHPLHRPHPRGACRAGHLWQQACHLGG
jgi:adenylosuccinate lyase